MYKYINITSNMQEMMVMLKSLPACTTIFDKDARLIDLNQSAINYLKIKAIDDFKTKRLRVLNDCNYLLSIIQELKTGRIITNKIYQVKSPDSNLSVISFSACMINGKSDLFLFQFFELTASWDEVMPKRKQKGSKVLQQISKIQENKHKLAIHKLFGDQAMKQQMFQNYLDEDKIEELSQKYPLLTYTELIVCGLIALKMSTDEIAMLTGRSINSIYVIKYRIFKKFDLNSCKELYQILITEYEPA
jgi:DNA-binding CsgD family transcriptional regulator